MNLLLLPIPSPFDWVANVSTSKNFASQNDPAQKILAGDAGDANWQIMIAPIPPAVGAEYRHGNGCNFVYVDGHVEFMNTQQVLSKYLSYPPTLF